jgi:6-methylsalicylate decarboxylase
MLTVMGITDNLGGEMVNQWIDIHAHFYPPETEEETIERWELMKEACWTSPEPPRWDPDSTLAYMDRAGIAMQILSNIPKSLPKLLSSNEYASTLVKQYPNRFGFLAALPTDQPKAALKEIQRASDTLHADGYAVTFHYNGVYLSDPRLRPVWQELDRRRAVVFAHPDAYAGGVMGRPCALLDVAFETARTATDMLYAGTFRDFPNVTFILAHCGGALPALSGRLLLLGGESWIPNPSRVTPDEMRGHLRRLFLDTAGICPTAIAAALAMTTHDRLLYGSDCGVPCTTELSMTRNIGALFDHTGLTPDEVQQIGRRALELFPGAAKRLQAANEGRQI